MLEPRCLMAASITNLTTYPIHGVEGQAFNHVLVATFTVKDAGKTAPHLSAGLEAPNLSSPYVVDLQTPVVQSAGKGRYDVYLSGNCVAVPPVSQPSQLPTWAGSVTIEMSVNGNSKPLVSHEIDVTFDITDVPLSQMGPSETIHATVGVDTGMVNLAAFADQNSDATFATTKYQVTIMWSDNQTTTFIGKQQTGVGQVSGSGGDWEVLSHHMYATPGTKQIVIKVVDDPPAVGGAGKETITLHAQAIVVTASTLQGVPRMFFLYRTPPPTSPVTHKNGPPTRDAADDLAYFFGAHGEPLSAYTFTVNWGDGVTTPAEVVSLSAGNIYPDAAIVANHTYAMGGPIGSPIFRTIRVTVTGPGIDPSKPLTSTTTASIFQNND